MEFIVVGLLLLALALVLRLRVFIGGNPGGVDTWYYLASAEALRRKRALPISLPQYLFHDATESYPAVFPVLLALLPQRLLGRYFWLLSPLIDAVHLLLLYLLAFRLTNSILAAAVAGLVYAITPQLISETRNLNGRAFASLLQTLCMVALLWALIPSHGFFHGFIAHEDVVIGAIVVLLVALLYNTHTSTAIAFGLSAGVLSIVSRDPRFVLAALIGFPAAVILSGGYYLRVLRNHLYAAKFWRRNVGFTRAHQVYDSPLFTGLKPGNSSGGLYAPGVRSKLKLAARVLGENPFVLAMLVTPEPPTLWGKYMYWWAITILAWAIATTFIRPLRIFGPGFHYMKASTFPAAYSLAVVVNANEHVVSTIAVVFCVIASFAGLAYFYRLMAMRETEHTASTPPELASTAEYLRLLPGKVVLVLPTMYADFVCYKAKKAVVWGGHSGNLSKLEEFFPVLRSPVSYFVRQYNVNYLVLDRAYASLDDLCMKDGVTPLQEFGNIAVYAV